MAEIMNKYETIFVIDSTKTEEEITAFVKKLNIPMSREYLEPCSNSMIIRRMLTNLISGFQQAGNAEKVQELTELRELLD